MGGGKGGKTAGTSGRGMGPLNPLDELRSEDGSSSDGSVCSHHPEFDKLENFEEEACGDGGAEVSEAGGCSRCQDLFSELWLDNAALCWQHMEKAHGFSIDAVRERMAPRNSGGGGCSWDMYHHIRLVTFFRKLGPVEALAAWKRWEDIGGGEGGVDFWRREDLLQPVDSADPLLFDFAYMMGEGEELNSTVDSSEEEGRSVSAGIRPVVLAEDAPARSTLDPELLRELKS